MLADQIVFVIFKFINFFLVIFIIYYLFKKYAFSSLKNIVLSQLNFNKTLNEKIKTLNVNLKDLNNLYIEQQNEINLLDNKLLKWSNFCAQIKKDDEELMVTMQKNINKKRMIQQENFDRDLLKKTVIPKSIDYAQQELQTKFEDTVLSKNYLDSLIAFIQKD